MLVDALEHPVLVMERRIGGAMEDQIRLELVVLSWWSRRLIAVLCSRFGKPRFTLSRVM